MLRRVSRSIGPLIVATLVATSFLPGLAGPVAAATQAVRLEAGPQTGYTFGPTGAILTTTTVTLPSPVDTSTDDRRWITGRGAYLRMTTGALSGLYVRESAVAHVDGLVVTKTFSTPTRVAFPAGRYLGYRFDATGGLVGSKYRVLSSSSGALASRRVVIDGRPYAQIVTGIWTGYWVPIVSQTTLTSDRIRCSAPAKVAAGGQQTFTVLPGAVGQMALTFDLGGRMTPALDILERLVIDRVCTTIFPTGAAASTSQGRTIMAFIAAHAELFEVGNHTYHHCNLRDGGGGSACPTSPASATFIGSELTSAASVIKAQTGRDPAPYWRPPYGASDARVRAAAAAVGYTKTFMWHIDTIDWRPVSATPTPGPTAAEIADKVVTKAVDGSIVLMHLGGYNTYDALPSMVMRLRAGGLAPTTASDILR